MFMRRGHGRYTKSIFTLAVQKMYFSLYEKFNNSKLSSLKLKSIIITYSSSRMPFLCWPLRTCSTLPNHALPSIVLPYHTLAHPTIPYRIVPCLALMDWPGEQVLITLMSRKMALIAKCNCSGTATIAAEQ